MTNPILAPLAALTLPDGAALTSRAQASLTFLRGMEIACADDYGLAAEELQAIKGRAKRLEEQRTAITGPMNDALRAVNALFKAPSEALAEGERILKTKMLAWDQEQERIAAEARRKAEAEAAAQRAKLAAEAAERERAAREQAEAAQKAAAAGDEAQAAVAIVEAERARAEAQTLTMAAQMTVAAAPVVEAPRAKGISKSTQVDYEVVNLLELVQHVAAHPEHIALLTVDSVKLRAFVKAVGVASRLPGVRVFDKTVMSARAAA